MNTYASDFYIADVGASDRPRGVVAYVPSAPKARTPSLAPGFPSFIFLTNPTGRWPLDHSLPADEYSPLGERCLRAVKSQGEIQLAMPTKGAGTQ